MPSDRKGTIRRWFGIFLPAAMLLMTACGTGGTPQGATDVTVDSTSLEVIRGDSGQVSVAVGDGFGAPVTLSVAGAPAEVVASFSETELAPGDAADLTVAVDAAAAEGAATLTVTATDGDASDTAEIDLTVTSLEVQGVVVGQLGQPAAGVGVTIDGADAVTTDANGAFTLDGVSVPYDLAVFDEADEWVHQVNGLRTATPEVLPYPLLLGSGLDGTFSATVEGTLSEEIGTDQRGRVCVEGDDRSIAGCTSLFEGATTYGLGVAWLGAGAVPATVHVVVHDLDGDGNVSGVASAGSAQTSLTDGSTETADVTLDVAAAGTTVDLDIVSPAGFDVAAARVMTNLSGGLSSLAGVLDDPTSASHTLHAPAFPGASYLVYGSVEGGDGSQAIGWVPGVAAGGDVTISPPAPPTVQGPADGAVDVTHATTLAIAGVEGHANLFVIAPAGDGPIVAIATLEDSVTLPDLSAVSASLALPASADYSWTVVTSSGFDAGDAGALATGGGVLSDYVGLVNALAGFGVGPAEGGDLTISTTRDFTTQ